MASNIYCAFELAGTALSGDVTVNTIGGVDVSADHIEGYELHFGTHVETKGQGQRASSRHRIEPVRLCKRTDGTTPLLYRALTQNQRLDGDIKIFDNHPDSGETRHRFTVRLSQCRIIALNTSVPDAFDADSSNRPVSEWLELMPHTIAYVDEVNGTEFEDVWRDGA